MRLDSHQQVSAAIAVVAIGYFVAHTIERKNEAQKIPAPTSQSSPVVAKTSPPTAASNELKQQAATAESAKPVDRPKLTKRDTANVKDASTRAESPMVQPPQKLPTQIEQTNPVNSPAIIGDHATVNYGPRARSFKENRISWNFVNSLASFKGERVRIRAEMRDREAFAFAQQFTAALRTIGLNVTPEFDGMIIDGSNLTGIAVYVTEAKSSFAAAIVKASTDEGFKAALFVVQDPRLDIPVVRVYPNP